MLPQGVKPLFLIWGLSVQGKEVLRLVDSLQRSKDIDKEIIFQAIESALESAAKKYFGSTEGVEIEIDRETGELAASKGGERVDPEALGRIAAQTAKQVIIQKIREAESQAIYEEYEAQMGNLVSGTVQRRRGGTLIIDMDRTEAILPKSEQVPGEHYQPGDRIRAVIVDVDKSPQRVDIILSRSRVELIERLFELEVPEIAEGVVQIVKIAREAGERTKLAVESLDARVDCIGACVGVRGTRIKSIIDEVNGEKIDIIAWNEAPEILISDALKPAEVLQITLEEGEHTKRAVVTVPEDQLSLAIGRKGQNVRLAVKLTGWDIDIQSPEEQEEAEEEGEAEAEQDELLEEETEEAVEPEEEAEEVDEAAEEAEVVEEGEEDVPPDAPEGEQESVGMEKD